MLKIVGGKHRGRAIEAPEGQATRPTASRAREALFNILVHANWRADGTSPLIDVRVLDAFAGSGALGLEALSRGAAHVRFVEKDRRAASAIDTLISEWQETGAQVTCADALGWLAQSAGGAPFDIVFLDPPYDAALLSQVAGALTRGALLAPDARIYVEHRAREGLPEMPAGWQQIRDGRAGEVGYHLFAV